jgi:hypothetical protein
VYVLVTGTNWLPLEIWHLSILQKYVWKIQVLLMNMKTVTVVKNVRITSEVTLAMTVEVKTILILKSARNLQKLRRHIVIQNLDYSFL